MGLPRLELRLLNDVVRTVIDVKFHILIVRYFSLLVPLGPCVLVKLLQLFTYFFNRVVAARFLAASMLY